MSNEPRFRVRAAIHFLAALALGWVIAAMVSGATGGVSTPEFVVIIGLTLVLVKGVSKVNSRAATG